MTETPLFARKAAGLVREVSGISAPLNNLKPGGNRDPAIGRSFDLRSLSRSRHTHRRTPLSAHVHSNCLSLSTVNGNFPSGGGDYVWITRILHPAIGFTFSSVVLIAVVGGAIALLPAWALQWGGASIFQGIGIPAQSHLVLRSSRA